MKPMERMSPGLPGVAVLLSVLTGSFLLGMSTSEDEAATPALLSQAPCVTKVVSLDTGNGLNVIGLISVSETLLDPDSGDMQRVVFMGTDYSLGNVVVSRGYAKATVAAAGAELVQNATLYVFKEMADEFVAHYLEPSTPWTDWPNEFGDCYEITVQPQGSLTWGDVKRPEDIVVTLAPFEDC